MTEIDKTNYLLLNLAALSENKSKTNFVYFLAFLGWIRSKIPERLFGTLEYVPTFTYVSKQNILCS